MEKQFRQGDVFIVQIEQLPPEAKRQSQQDRIVLAYGEATGHSHAVSASEATLYASQDQNYLVVDDIALLVHEEHSPITLPAGIYRVVRQKEYDPIFGTEFVYD